MQHHVLVSRVKEPSEFFKTVCVQGVVTELFILFFDFFYFSL